MSSKGIPPKLDLNNFLYKYVLFNDAPHFVSFDQLRLDNKKQMSHATLNKKGLSNLHIKTFVQQDKVTCTPLMVDGEYV